MTTKIPMIITKISRKIARLAQFMENPELLRLRRKGISINTFLKLNQPWLIKTNINTVFDIGASTGRYARIIHEVLPAAYIYSFEPLKDCYEELQERMQKVRNFSAFNVALGDDEGEIEFHRNEYSASSSILPMADLHKQNFPFTAQHTTIKVKSARLDDIARDLEIKDNLLIKIDVQGFEDKVIAGGRNTIKRATILIIETSFQTLYVGQPLFEDIYDSLKEYFRYLGSLNQAVSSIDGSILYADCIFIRKNV